MSDKKEFHEEERDGVSIVAEGQVCPAGPAIPNWLRRLQNLETWVDRKLNGIELQGVDWLPESQSQRHAPPLSNIFLIWLSFNIHAPSLTLGMLGPELGLSLHLTIAAAITGIVIGAAFSAFNATLGPKLGLRQIASCRFSFGIWGARLCSVLNIITVGGFLVVGLISVGSLLSAAFDYHLSVVVGIIVVSVISYLVSSLSA